MLVIYIFLSISTIYLLYTSRFIFLSEGKDCLIFIYVMLNGFFFSGIQITIAICGVPSFLGMDALENNDNLLLIALFFIFANLLITEISFIKIEKTRFLH